MSKNELLNPKIKNRVMKLRKGAVRRKKAQVLSSIKFDKIESDNIKKILWMVWLSIKDIFIWILEILKIIINTNPINKDVNE